MRQALVIAFSILLVGNPVAIGASARRPTASEKPRKAEAFEWLRNAFMQTSLTATFENDSPEKRWGLQVKPLRFRELRECVVSMETESRYWGSTQNSGHVEAQEVDFSTLNPDVVVKEHEFDGTKEGPPKILHNSEYSVTAYAYQLRKVVRVKLSRLPDDPGPAPPDMWRESVIFSFPNKDLLDRTARALRAAIEKCGGRREDF